MGLTRSKDEWEDVEAPSEIDNEDELYFELSRNSAWQRYQIRRLHGVFRRAQQAEGSKAKKDSIGLRGFRAAFFAGGAVDQGDGTTADDELSDAFFTAFGPGKKGLTFVQFLAGVENAVIAPPERQAALLLRAMGASDDVGDTIDRKALSLVLGDVTAAAAGGTGDGAVDAQRVQEYLVKQTVARAAALARFDVLPTVEQERNIIKSILSSSQLEAGARWYLISCRWLQSWKEYVKYEDAPAQGTDDKTAGGDAKPRSRRASSLGLHRGTTRQATRPISIENGDLQGEGYPGSVKQGLVENRDYQVVPERAWQTLREWYGGGPEFSRTVIQVGDTKLKRVEVFPPGLAIALVDERGDPDPEAALRSLFSCQTQVTELHALARKYHKIPAKSKTRLWLQDTSDDGAGALLRLDPPLDNKQDTVTNAESSAASGQDASAAVSTSASSDGKASAERQRRAMEAAASEAADRIITLADANARHGQMVLLEVKNSKSSTDPWPLEANQSPSNWREFKVGDVVDAKDAQGNWYQAHLLKIDGDRVRVHYENWDSKWDEWISKTKESDRFAPAGKYSTARAGGRARRRGSKTQRGRQLVKGVCGLRNLGNTCFMNSTLQCMSNTPIFNSFFSNGRFVSDLNKTNPLGTGGKLAGVFGMLLRDMWSGEYAAVAPSAFKRTIGRFAPRFSGYSQQDSQELLAYLLDGLHEDLNRVKKKKPTKNVEAKGRPDDIVGAESWETYLKRNRSVIVDLFMGQLKSTVVCPSTSCGNVSVTFDPFMFLTLPFPAQNKRRLTVHMVLRPPKTPKAYVMMIDARASCAQIWTKLQALSGVPVDNIVIADVYKSKVYRWLRGTTKASTIQRNDLLVAFDAEPPAIDAKVTDAKATDAKAADAASADREGDAGTQGKDEAQNEAGTPGEEKVKDTVYEVPLLQAELISEETVDAETQERVTTQRLGPVLGTPLLALATKRQTSAQLHAAAMRALQPFIPKDAKSNDMPVLYVVPKYGVSSAPKRLEPGAGSHGVASGDNVLVAWPNAKVMSEVLRRAEPSKWEQVLDDEAKTKKGLNVYDCLEQYCKQEVLSKNDTWYCGKCKQHREATKQLELFKFPEILIIHLKRFVQVSSMHREKINAFVDFPIKGLDLSEYVISKNQDGVVYDLFAVSNHMGGIGGGHYTAYARNQATNRWYVFDDSRTQEVNIMNVKSRAAYVLYYQRRH